jgi:hypothetical protein
MEQGMLNNRQQEQLQGIAALGRNEDTYLAHVAPDEMIVPAQALRDNPLLKVAIEKSISNYGIDPNQFLVGNGSMDLNPLTGLPEFGFLSKVWKKAKKVIKKIAPIAAVIPGPWTPFAITYNKANALNNIAKGDGGIGDLLTLGAGGSQKVFGKDGALQSITSGDFKNIGGGFGSALSNIGQVDKLDKLGNVVQGETVFNPFRYGAGLGKTYAEDQKQGYGGIFKNVGGADTLGGQAFNAVTSGGNPVNSMITAGYTPGMEGGMMPTSNQSAGGDITSWLNNNFDTSDRTMINGQVAIRSKDGNYYTQEQAKQMYNQQSQPQSSGMFGGKKSGQSYLGTIEDFLKGKKSDFSTSGSGRIGIDRTGVGSIFGGNPGQSGIGRIEDFIKGNPSDPVRDSSGGMFGGNLGLMGLAGLAGKVAYDAAKERMGGMAETPKVTMDQLGRYQMAQNLGTGGSRADFGLAPAPVALNFAKGDAVEMEDYINKMTNELIESYKKDKKYRESSLLPASYIMNEKQEASSEAAKRNDPMTGLKPSYHLVKGVIRILTGESGNRIPQRKIDEIKNMVRSSVKEKQMTQMGFNMGGMAELDMREGGESEGPGTGTSDDIPAMLSDGEFVMTAKATRGAGSFNVNKTKSGIELIKGGSASRKKGVENMRELMNIFEAV